VDNRNDTYLAVPRIEHIVTLTEAEYNGLAVPDVNTLYVISGSAVDSAFPYTGSAQITGSLGVTGSAKFNGAADFTGGDFKVTDQNRNGEFDVDTFKVKTQKGAQFTGSLSVSAGFTASLQSGYAWVGGAGNVSTAVATASFGAGVGFPFVGNAQITGSINVSGSYLITSQSFTGSLVDNISPTTTNLAPVKHVVAITSASYAALGTKDPNTLYVVSGSAITGSGGGSGFPFSGNAVISGSLTVTGSFIGNVVSASVASSTASIDFSAGDFYTCLITGSQFFNITNIKPGEVCNLLLKTVQNGPTPPTASFSTNVKQVSGSRYLPTSGSTGKEDILTFVSFDSTNVYLAKINNLV
jgi:hypothetical protein